MTRSIVWSIILWANHDLSLRGKNEYGSVCSAIYNFEFKVMARKNSIRNYQENIVEIVKALKQLSEERKCFISM